MPQNLTNDKPTMVQENEPMLTQFYVAIWRHQAKMS